MKIKFKVQVYVSSDSMIVRVHDRLFGAFHYSDNTTEKDIESAVEHVLQGNFDYLSSSYKSDSLKDYCLHRVYDFKLSSC